METILKNSPFEHLDFSSFRIEGNQITDLFVEKYGTAVFQW